MDACVIDWKLVIDGSSAIATAWIATWAIRAGISTFKKQRAIDIRI